MHTRSGALNGARQPACSCAGPNSKLHGARDWTIAVFLPRTGLYPNIIAGKFFPSV
jgi:hypothetical protein